MAKSDNRKVYVMANHQPRHKAAERIGTAQARQEHSDSLTLEQKIANLPPAPLAAKARAKYLRQLEARKAKPVVKAIDVAVDVITAEPAEKLSKSVRKYMRGNENETKED